MTSDGRARGLRRLQRDLDYSWADMGLLAQALRHPSYTLGARLGSNQRLEFIGDSVIDLAVGIELMRRHPSENEGFLATMRATLVNDAALAIRGRALMLHRLVQVQFRGQQLRLLDSTAAQCMEAVVGSAFIDSGCDFSVALRVVRKAGVIGR
jgi:ribonuclease-3